MSHGRPPALAGRFYPADAHELRRAVAGYVADAVAPPRTRSDGPRAIIAPHAGYVFSGPVAGSAFGALTAVRRAVVIGPSHHVGFDGIATSEHSTFDTPLGPVAIDVVGVDLARRFQFVEDAEPVHAPEHSIETHLPFLQAINPDVRVIPLLTGRCEERDVAAVLDQLWDDETVVCVSSDLSHFEEYDDARTHDAKTAQQIARLQGDIGPRDACGSVAIRGLLHLARSRRMDGEILDLRNSGDTAGGRERVVGYGAFGFWSTS